MAGAGAGADQGSGGPQAPGAAGGTGPRAGPDWAGGLPDDLLVKVAETLVAQHEAGWAAWLKRRFNYSEAQIQLEMAWRKGRGEYPLFIFARVCKPWRKAQLKVGGRLHTRVLSDVIEPGSVALMKWALAEGCPREDEDGWTMTEAAALHGHLELVKWLCGEGFAMDKKVLAGAAICGNLNVVQWLIKEQGFLMDKDLMLSAARSGSVELVRWLRGEGCPCDNGTTRFVAAENGRLELVRWLIEEQGFAFSGRINAGALASGNLELVQWLWEEKGFLHPGDPWICLQVAACGHLEVLQWLRAKGADWDQDTCQQAVQYSHMELLRWARENGCPWTASTRDKAAAELEYTDDFGNLESDDEYGYEDDEYPDDEDESSDEYSDDE